jgi:hypothetical protein
MNEGRKDEEGTERRGYQGNILFVEGGRKKKFK